MRSFPMQADGCARRGRKDRQAQSSGSRTPVASPTGTGSKGFHARLKHYTRRLLRRWAKQDPENAPTKNRYRGYET